MTHPFLPRRRSVAKVAVPAVAAVAVASVFVRAWALMLLIGVLHFTPTISFGKAIVAAWLLAAVTSTASVEK